MVYGRSALYPQRPPPRRPSSQMLNPLELSVPKTLTLILSFLRRSVVSARSTILQAVPDQPLRSGTAGSEANRKRRRSGWQRSAHTCPQVPA